MPPLLFGLLVPVRGEFIGGGSALDGEPALRDESALEFHHAAQSLEAFRVGFALARVQHADAVDDGGDGGAHAAAEVLPVGADAEVVVAARPSRLGHDPQLARPRLRRHQLA